MQPSTKMTHVRVFPVWLFQVITTAISAHPLVIDVAHHTPHSDVLTVKTNDGRTLDLEVIARRPLKEINDAAGALMTSIVVGLRRTEPILYHEINDGLRRIAGSECPLCHARLSADEFMDGIVSIMDIPHEKHCPYLLATLAQVDEVEDA